MLSRELRTDKMPKSFYPALGKNVAVSWDNLGHRFIPTSGRDSRLLRTRGGAYWGRLGKRISALWAEFGISDQQTFIGSGPKISPNAQIADPDNLVPDSQYRPRFFFLSGDVAVLQKFF